MLGGYFWVIYSKGWDAGLFTIGMSAGACLLVYLTRHSSLLQRASAYVAFFTTPLLTLTGQISVLTGFAGTSNAAHWFGVSFVTASLAHAIYQNTLSPKLLLLSLLQPARWNSGPCAVHTKNQPHFRAPWRSSARLVANFQWIVLGAFFYGVASSAIWRVLILKHSSQPMDVLLFAAAFELYVYFNFAGISFIVFGLMRLVGVPCQCNFNTPFVARNVVGYWQRWHMSLSAILKAIFFIPLKRKIGLPLTVLAVFLGSAVWHGISINFIIWGCFHAACWFLSYKLSGVTGSQRWVQVALLFFAVLIGRLIFSESDAPVLWEKLSALISLDSWRETPIWPHIHLDWQNHAALLVAFFWFLAEASGCKLVRRYKILRTPVTSTLLFLCVIVFGSFDMGGVYGRR